MKLIFYDFEVFKHLWLVVLIEYETKEKTIIINNPDELKRFYHNNVDNIFVGYNSRTYDQVIFKGILNDLDPYEVNNQIILEEKKGFQIIKDFDKIPFNNFDTMTGFQSLKQLEAFMGSKIKESSVSFDLDRPLTKEEIDETIEYCTHDVEETIKVFDNRKEEFDSQLSLIKTFDLPMTMFNKTKPQLSAHIIGAVRQDSFKDEFNLSFPDTLRIGEKYQHILDWYNNPMNMDYKKSLNTIVAEVPHVFRWGGIHGAINNCIEEGIILCLDAESLYPALIIEYCYMSRNVPDILKYKEIRDTRLKLKSENNPMQAPYKIVLNSTFGAMKDIYNSLYDPLMANNICIAGQLLLLDLIEKIESKCKILQSNTDGIFLKVNSEEDINIIKSIAREWEERTRLNLEWETFTKLYQKDVNNYIIINKEGKYKSKGAYVKKLNKLDYDLPIINKALVNYFIHNKPLEETINECNELIEFQKVVKVSKLYKYAIHGDKKINEKVLRVFASKEESEKGVFKVKSKDKIEKIANTPEKCFIYNDSVIGITVPEKLDKQYYIDLANKRLLDFIDTKNPKKISNPSDIKFVNQIVKDELINLSEKEYDSFIDVLVEAVENTSADSKQIEIMIKLNTFKKYGGNKKLLNIFSEFKNGKNKYSKSHIDKTKQNRINLLKEYENNCEVVEEVIHLKEQMKFECEMCGYPRCTYEIDKSIAYVLEVETTYSPKIILYGLRNGKVAEMKIERKIFNSDKLKSGDIIQILKFHVKPKTRRVDGEFKAIEGTKEFWITEYDILKI